MSDETEAGDQERRKPLSLKRPGRLELKETVDAGQVRQSFSHGRSRAVAVEVRKKRTLKRGPAADGGAVAPKPKAAPRAAPPEPVAEAPPLPQDDVYQTSRAPRSRVVLRTLTSDEKAARARAVEDAVRSERQERERAVEEARRRAVEEERHAAEHAQAERRKSEEDARRKAEEDARKRAEEDAARRLPQPEEPKAEAAAAPGAAGAVRPARPGAAPAEEERGRPRRRGEQRRPASPSRRDQPRRRGGKIRLSEALDGTDLASRMAVRGAEVVKRLMEMGTIVTITQSIDADTAQLAVEEFGHKVRRVSEADVEIGLKGEDDTIDALLIRSPVVTVMGHVDHGKTSLLDAIRSSDVASGEAGGITQHIGAYQVETPKGARITFIDTPGHAAFTEMRARGASVTDIVVLVVAADDGVMPQTAEAINHARAAGVPILVAINKIDRPDADPNRVRQDLLQHEIVTEAMGGDVLAVEISATQKLNLDKLEEAILLQAELLELTANPDRAAEGVVIEAKRGTLRIGDIVVAGAQWGRVRAMYDDHGAATKAAGPAVPVEVLGLSGAPQAGDEVVVVENERRAREVSEFRHARTREKEVARGAPLNLEQLFSEIQEKESKSELPLVIKTDVQGSAEALVGALARLGTDEVAARVLHSGVGGITEADVTLAAASDATVFGFNVRANAQARELAARTGIELRYFAVIYDVVDEVRASLEGMLRPEARERTLGNAQILQVFEVGRVGRIAGCRVTNGLVRRGSKARLLRDDVVIHDGALKTLRRFKDDVREVKEGYECGMSFENHSDLREGDVIELYEIEEIARTLEA
ncbi:Translation initiation factor IF-2 [Geodia barretti]|uniref:Translation initiation factor IF-2, chloroplastic n=1 Tax=Geodia barretti TaxID=519541 RepID=A0AA35R850_GEOBA|nr:Translation initiation factor IF-2 [Geodia barretti]